MNIVVVGSLNMDLVSHVPRLPKAGETITSTSFQTIPGGKGANQAVAAARLGANVHMIGKVGCDTYGDMLLESLADSLVNTGGIGREGTTGMALINVSGRGENNIVLVPGANGMMGKADIDRHIRLLEGCDVLLVQLEIPLAVVEYAVKLAHDRGKLVVLNPAPAQSLSPSFLRHVDTVTPNETELELLSGMPVETLSEIEAAAEKLLGLGPKRIVVTMGEKGALIVNADGATHIPALKVQAVDTTAAGDSFTAAFTVGMAKGMTDEGAGTFASRVAAIAVTRHGAQPSLPTLAEVDALQAE
ncbi:ribokinase [Brevibacillus borstelensis]|uniref:ribokinase n=1 Tax=Brevibacillus borstelensis TaxID=45462 RepID=UPI0004F30A0F|nr:ribokinase [Brevibacillus borstelensis]KKX56452.1 ribokinase [Brevibacillus borstelensis cifa_chp40]